jgi:pyruvate kinase
MDVARLNFSHGTHDDHRALFEQVRAMEEASGRVVGVLADLQGPRIRLGRLEGGEARLETGAEFVLTAEPVTGDARRASTTYERLASDVKAGDTLLIDDGRVRLEAIATDGRALRTRVVEGGRIADHKGINLPGVAVSAPALTPKDVEDLRFALQLGVDLVALSFVRAPADAEAARRILAETGSAAPLIAKIERAEAVAHLEALVEAFDGLMVARGDLGVELPLEQVPMVQKRAIALARCRARPVIVATQMLESMIHATRPTRAEVSDVANAVLDGADAVMLSGETSVGERPAETVATMARIITAAEAAEPATLLASGRPALREEALGAAAARLAADLGAVAIVAYTESGGTARWVARQRPRHRLLAFTTGAAMRRKLAPVWGVETLVVSEVSDTDSMVRQVDHAVREQGLAQVGDVVVIVSGAPPGARGSTNTLRVHRVGNG